VSALDLANPAPLPGTRARSNGWWGMAIFLVSELTLIGSIIGSYFYLCFNTSQWPPAGTPEPTLRGPLVLTLALAASLLPFRAALAAARRGARGAALALLAGATCIQSAYLGIQIHLFADDLARFTPQQSAYASVYYVLLGAAHAHVVVGLFFDLWLLMRLSTRLTPYRLVALDAVALYWAVVVALTVAMVITELSPRL
jgi:heme/copper-type cytochrome/quinol oxidase subunit 3